MDTRNIKHIVIVGGGSAGWMSAAMLANTLEKKNIAVTLVESEQIGTVGVGEATIPPIKTFNQRLGIDERQFMRETNATFKLGIEFVNWTKPEHRYFHPFGVHGRDFDLLPLYQFWLKHNQKGEVGELDEFSMASQMACNTKFEHPLKDPRYIQSTFDYAYHLDANRYAAFLRTYSEARGVERIEGKIEDVVLCSQTGFIQSVVLENGHQIDADFFVDCSGFRSLLLGKALNTSFINWQHWLPCDRAVAMATEGEGTANPFTRSTRHRAGWQWTIPLQHRTGNGHVYSSEFVSDDDALVTLTQNTVGAPLSEPNFLRFETGRRQVFWNKNCLGIGLAAGFMEPLESTSLHLVVTGISRFLAHFPDKQCHPALVKEYNELTVTEYEGIRDFLILHYYANQHQDKGFWQACANMALPDSLQHRLDLYKHNGKLVIRKAELFQPVNWMAVLAGQQVLPSHYDPLVDERNVDAAARLSEIRDVIKQTIGGMPQHSDYLAKFLS